MPVLPPETKLARLRAALEMARLDFDETLAKARAGEVQFHETEDAVAVTALTTSGPYRTCFVVALAGVMSGVSELGAKVEAFAREHGCDMIELDGRPGWERMFDKVSTGYVPILTKYRKRLD